MLIIAKNLFKKLVNTSFYDKIRIFSFNNLFKKNKIFSNNYKSSYWLTNFSFSVFKKIKNNFITRNSWLSTITIFIIVIFVLEKNPNLYHYNEFMAVITDPIYRNRSTIYRLIDSFIVNLTVLIYYIYCWFVDSLYPDFKNINIFKDKKEDVLKTSCINLTNKDFNKLNNNKEFKLKDFIEFKEDDFDDLKTINELIFLKKQEELKNCIVKFSHKLPNKKKSIGEHELALRYMLKKPKEDIDFLIKQNYKNHNILRNHNNFELYKNDQFFRLNFFKRTCLNSLNSQKSSSNIDSLNNQKLILNISKNINNLNIEFSESKSFLFYFKKGSKNFDIEYLKDCYNTNKLFINKNNFLNDIKIKNLIKEDCLNSKLDSNSIFFFELKQNRCIYLTKRNIKKKKLILNHIIFLEYLDK